MALNKYANMDGGTGAENEDKEKHQHRQTYVEKGTLPVVTRLTRWQRLHGERASGIIAAAIMDRSCEQT